MIQRIQTVYWLASILVLVAVIFLPLFEQSDGQLFHTADCKALTAVIAVSITLSGINIFLFKKRALQIKLGYALILLHLAILILTGAHFFLEKGEKILLWSALPVVSLALQYLAIGGVKKDEALIKSMDRLR